MATRRSGPAFSAPRRSAGNAGAASVSGPDSLHGQPLFVPMSTEEMHALGWDSLDVLFVTGDAYVDHSSFGSVLLARWLIHHGFRAGIVAQPRWDSPDDLLVMGRPRLFAGISAGALDSLLAHYTAFRKKRHDDAYTPGGKAGARPNRACLVYANLARRAFPGLPLALGGIEASLRRVSHYDFWTDALRKPILMDAKADLLIWGMGEYATLEYARRLHNGEDTRGIPGTAWLDKLEQTPEGPRPASLPQELAQTPAVPLPSHEDILTDPVQLLVMTQALERQVHRLDAWAFQPVGDRALVLARPAPPLTTEEMDDLYEIPFTRRPHPSYREAIPAAEMMRTSITSHRGCGGGCSFCSLALHQGRRISSRSEESILAEARRLGRENMDRGKGPVAISDVGGPTANMWQGYCALDRMRERSSAGRAASAPDQQPLAQAAMEGGVEGGAERGNASRCRRTSCCYPTICKFFTTPQGKHVGLLRSVAALPEVKQARVASGVRADLALRDAAALAAYTGEFTGGQLKVAPEHCAPGVLSLMRKPPLEVFEAFLASFVRQSKAAGREQYVVPYLLSGFPGCTDDDMRTLADWLRKRNWNPRQTQCFIPTPGTIATAMFYCGKNEAGDDIYVARTDAQRLRQHGILMPERSSAEGRRPGRPARPDSPDRPGRPGKKPAVGKEDTAGKRPGQKRGHAEKARDGNTTGPATGSGHSRESHRSEKSGRPDRSGKSDRSGRPDRPNRPNISGQTAEQRPTRETERTRDKKSGRGNDRDQKSGKFPVPGRRA